jgi:hypothetical protein
MSDPSRDDDFPGRDDSFDIDIEGFDDINFRESQRDSEYPPSENADLELEKLLKLVDNVVGEEANEVATDFYFDEETSPVSRPKGQPKAPAESESEAVHLTERLFEDEEPEPPQTRVKSQPPRERARDFGQERVERERFGQDRSGQERFGQERIERERSVQERFGQERIVRERSDQERSGQERFGQERFGQERIERERFGQESIERERSKQAPPPKGPATIAQLSPLEFADIIERAVERGVRKALAAKKAARKES